MPDYNFKSIRIDLEKGIYEINGESVKGLPITDLTLNFDGSWKLNFALECIESERRR